MLSVVECSLRSVEFNYSRDKQDAETVAWHPRRAYYVAACTRRIKVHANGKRPPSPNCQGLRELREAVIEDREDEDEMPRKVASEANSDVTRGQLGHKVALGGDHNSQLAGRLPTDELCQGYRDLQWWPSLRPGQVHHQDNSARCQDHEQGWCQH